MVPKGERLRYVPMTTRLASALEGAIRLLERDEFRNWIIWVA